METGQSLRRRVLLAILLVSLGLSELRAQQPNGLIPSRDTRVPTSRVSPVLEIEILDPNCDPRGNPAVVVGAAEDGVSQIEIPPSLIVHRYYYTGDRSFRGPNFPGGPSIVIATDPRSGQRTYLSVQMLPGSPIVSYSSRSIEYDFGNRAVIIAFPHVGEATVRYRNGRPTKEKLAHVLGVDMLKSAVERSKTSLASAQHTAGVTWKASGMVLGDLAQPITLPIQNIARFMPGNAALTDPSLEARVLERAAIEQRAREVARLSSATRAAEVDVPRF